MVQLGEKHTVRTENAAYQDEKTGVRMLTGTVVFIDPKYRYVTLEFEGIHGNFRECFPFMDLDANIPVTTKEQRRKHH